MNRSPILLFVDDDPAVLGFVCTIFARTDIQCLTASCAYDGIELITREHPDVVLLDVNLPDMSGLDVFRHIERLDPKLPVLFITGEGTAETAIEAMKLGAFDYLLKDSLAHMDGIVRLQNLVQRACEISRSMHIPTVMPGEVLPEGPNDALVGRSSCMQTVYKLIGRVASQEVTVLILGESGTGKELVARAIYHHSDRSSRPFLSVNCAAIPEALLESELFGHEKGAFTGADRTRIGKFEQCSGGTLFLDEIGEMSPRSQAKVLRALQEKEIHRIGSNKPLSIDVRLIAATNRELDHLVATGEFRADIYYRLNVFTIKLPPLRDRTADMRLLVEYFLKRYNSDFGRNMWRVADDTFALLAKYPWPGNVRELQSVIKQALLQGSGPVLLPDFLPDQIRCLNKTSTEEKFADLQRAIRQRLEEGSTNLYAETVARMEQALFSEVLRFTSNNKSLAARILGVSRNFLKNRIRTLGLSDNQSRLGDEESLK